MFGEANNEDDFYRKLHAVLYDCGEREYNIIIDAVIGTAMAVKRSLRVNRLSDHLQ